MKRYLTGYTETTSPQDQEAAPGDPQRSALVQYLLDHLETDPERIVLDFGSGNGVLAYEMNHIWPTDRLPPVYMAVDLPESVNELALPSRIHNRSIKCTVEDFYER